LLHSGSGHPHRQADEDATEHRAFEDRRGKGDDAGIVQRRFADLVHRTAGAQQQFAFRHQPLQAPPVPEVEHIQRVATAPHSRDECHLVVVVQCRRIEGNQYSSGHARRIVTGERDHLQTLFAEQEDSLRGAPLSDLCSERHMPRRVERGQWTGCECRERPAAWHGVTERRHLCYACRLGEEDALPPGRAQHGGVERDLTARIDRREDRLPGDVEPIEATAARRWLTGLDDGAQRFEFGCWSAWGPRRDVRRGLRRCRRWRRRRDPQDGSPQRRHHQASGQQALPCRREQHRSVAQHA
jgi:hypothetical protein